MTKTVFMRLNFVVLRDYYAHLTESSDISRAFGAG